MIRIKDIASIAQRIAPGDKDGQKRIVILLFLHASGKKGIAMDASKWITVHPRIQPPHDGEHKKVCNMCNLSEGFYELGVEKGMEQCIEKGRVEMLLDALRNMMDGLHLTLENTMDVLHVAEGLRPGIRKALA